MDAVRQSPPPLLYTYRRCPYAMRARLALGVAGIAFDAHEIVLRAKPAGLLAASPKGTVPVLVLNRGQAARQAVEQTAEQPIEQVIEQSWEIVRWALTRPGLPASIHGWWQRSQTPQNEALRLINDGSFKLHLDRYKYPERATADHPLTGEAARAHHRAEAVQVLLAPLEARLAEAPFLGGATPCATDIGIFPFVRQFAAVDSQWFGHLPLPRLQQWLAGWLQSPLFVACMTKLPADVTVAFEWPR